MWAPCMRPDACTCTGYMVRKRMSMQCTRVRLQWTLPSGACLGAVTLDSCKTKSGEERDDELACVRITRRASCSLPAAYALIESCTRPRNERHEDFIHREKLACGHLELQRQSPRYMCREVNACAHGNTATSEIKVAFFSNFVG